MGQEERLSTIIGGIYDASLDPSLWKDVLGQTAAFVGGLSAGLYAKDATAKTGVIYYDDGRLDQNYVNLYFDKYIKLDPSTTAQFFAEIGEPFATADMMPYDEFVETRFYKEWAEPQRLVDCMNTVLEKSTTSVAMIGVFRDQSQGIIDDTALRRMRLLVPHVRRALLISKIIELKTAEADSLADTLDGLSAGMFLVDAQGRIVHANAVGHAMLADGSVLNAAAGKLAACDLGAEQVLHEVFLASDAGDSAVGTNGIAVPLTKQGGEPYVAHVLPLTSGARRSAGSTYKASAALFVHKAALDTPSPPEAIAKAYKLTPTELRVLLAIVQVGGVPEVAEALGIAESTVKTHLGRLYEKTRTRRQADLVKVVAGFANPLA
jgi:DNA-binding CsgD family transcriptional regulator